MITIVDYGVGNLGSIRNMLKKIGADSRIATNAAEISGASKLILPGVGAFDAGMRSLTESGYIPYLNEAVLERSVPVLGICLGMQLMTLGSEEGQLPGLGWIQATTTKFRPGPGESLRIPHMGWNVVKPMRQSALVADLLCDSRFYFVHSYHVRCEREEDVVLRSAHGSVVFDAAFQNGNIFGVQFHPEKSHRFGLALLTSFVEAV